MRRPERLGVPAWEAYGESISGREITMYFMLYLLVPLFVLFAWAVVFDLRRRHAPGHDIEAAARRAGADADARRAAGGN
jgi:hypothetical protein